MEVERPVASDGWRRRDESLTSRTVINRASPVVNLIKAEKWRYIE